MTPAELIAETLKHHSTMTKTPWEYTTVSIPDGSYENVVLSCFEGRAERDIFDLTAADADGIAFLRNHAGVLAKVAERVIAALQVIEKHCDYNEELSCHCDCPRCQAADRAWQNAGQALADIEKIVEGETK